MIKRFESEFIGFQNIPLYYQGWTSTSSRGVVLVTHGQAEHSGCYERLAQGFKGEWDLIAWDLRGHGKSEGKRGYTGHFDDYVKDWVLFYDHVRQTLLKGRPLIILGHSMGALIQLLGLLKVNSSEIKAQVLSSPLLKVAVPVPPIKDKAARFLFKVWPSLTLGNEIKYEHLTRDTEIQKTYALDPLRHDQISSGVYIGMIEGMARVHSRVKDYALPTFMQLAGQDKIVDRVTAEKFFAQLSMERKTLKIYQTSEHEIYNCLERKVAYEDLLEYLKTVV